MPHKIIQTESTRQAASDSTEGAETFTKCFSEVMLNAHEAYERLKKKGHIFNGIPVVKIVANAKDESFEFIDPFEGIGETEEDFVAIFEKKSARQQTHTGTSRSMMGRGLSDVLTRNMYAKYYSLLYSKRNGVKLGYKIEWVPIPNKPNERQKEFNSCHDSAEEKAEIENKIPTPSGTYVKFFWKSSEEDDPFPPKENLKKHLYCYHELRNVLNDPGIKFELTYIPKSASSTTEQLEFFNPKYNKVASFPGPIPLKFKLASGVRRTDYKIEILDFNIFESDQLLNMNQDELRTQGIYIQGESEPGFTPSIYTLTFFGLEGTFPSSSKTMFATMTLSKDAKEYIMDCYDVSKPVFSKTREGFRKETAFYRALDKEVKNRIVPLLQKSSSTRFEESDDATKAGIDEINKFVREVVEVTPIVGEGEVKVPEYGEFAKDSVKIVKGKNYKINLLLNPDKFRTGSIIDVEHDPTVIVTPPKRVPDFRDAKIGEIPFIIKSDSLGTKNIPNEGVALRAKITPKDGTDFSPELKIECIDERHQKPFWPDKNLQFNPASISVKSFEDKHIDLWMDPKTVYPGQTIRVTFIPERGMNITQPIKVTEPDAGELPNSYDFSFKIENTQTFPDHNGYRKKTITFEIVQSDLKGTIEAVLVGANPDQYTDVCKFEVENDKEGLINDWTIESHAIDQYVYLDGIPANAIFNSRNAIVAETLGKSKEEALKRVKLYEEARLLLAKGLTHVALERAMLDEYEKRIANYPNEAKKDWRTMYNDTKKNYDGWFFKLYPIVSKVIEVGPRDTTPEILHESKITVTFDSFEKKYDLDWYKDTRETETTQKAGTIELNIPGFEGTSTRETYVFRIKKDEFRVGVYRFDNGNVAVRFDSFDWYTKREDILKALRDNGAILGLKEPNSTPNNIPQGWVYAPLEVQCYRQNKLEMKKITSSNLLDVPDHPSLNGGSDPTEVDDTWIKSVSPKEDYVMYSTVATTDPDNTSSLNREQFCYFMDPDDIDQIALNFVRLFIMRPYAYHDFVREHLKKIMANPYECTSCHSTCSPGESMIEMFGLTYDEKTPTISDVCQKCQAREYEHDKQMGDAFL